MKIIFRFFLIFMLVTYFAQLPFSQVGNPIFSEFPDGSVYTCLENNDTCMFYLSTVHTGDQNSNNRIHTALFLDHGCDGEDFEQLTLVDTSSVDFALPHNMFKYTDLYIEITWYVLEDSVRRFFERFNFYDSQFQILKSVDFETISPSFKLLEAIDGDTLKFIGFNDASPDFHTIYTFNPFDTSMRRNTINIDIGFMSSIIFDSLYDQYYCFHSTGLAILNPDFELQHKFNGPEVHTALFGQIAPLGDQIITHGVRRPDFSEHQLTFNVFDKELNLLYEDTYGDLGERDYPFITSSIDITEDFIFTGGNLDITIAWFSSTRPTEYVVSKYDLNKELLWRKRFGGDVSYVMYGIKGTADGGCLVYGSRRDESSDIRFPFIQKIDRDGLLTSDEEISKAKGFSFKILGNPVVSSLKIEIDNHLHADLLLILVNTLGQTVKSVPIVEGLNDIGVDELPQGIYYAVVSNKNNGQVLSSQKILISR